MFLLVGVSSGPGKLGYPNPPPPQGPGPQGGPMGPPRAQGALRAPWGRTALRAVHKLLFGFPCELLSMSRVRMRSAVWLSLPQTGTEYPKMFWNGPEWFCVDDFHRMAE